MRAFDHVFLTRFSAVHAAGLPPVQEDWLRYRLGFFEEACLASMSRQTVRDFRWLVFVDDRCSESFRRDFEALATDVFEPVWTHELFWSGVFREALTDASHAPYLITSRLDSDDAVAVDFVESVQAQFDGQERLFLNFTRGLQLERSGAVYRYDQSSNPFLSLIERRHDGVAPATVFGQSAHGAARTVAPLREVKAPPMWIQVIHGSNVANLVCGPRVDPAVVAERFDIDLWYRDDVSAPRLLLEKARQQVRVWSLRACHPRFLQEWLVTRLDRLRGTRDKPVLGDRGRRRADRRLRIDQRRQGAR
jgi:hypothetical protein